MSTRPIGTTERFGSFDGLSIAYGVHGEEEAGSAVLLHHGFASTSAINWVRPGLVEALAEAGRRVVFLDARGHGDSEHPHDPHAYADAAMARDVLALAHHLGLDRVDMAGYSMGSFVTIEVATRAPGLLRSIFLGGIGTGQARIRSGAYLAIAEALEADDPSQVTDPTGKAFRNFADATGQDRLALAAIQRSGMSFDVEALSSLHLPAVVVNGERDTLIGDPSSVAERIEGARSITVPGDHISAVVKDEFRQALVSFATSR